MQKMTRIHIMVLIAMCGSIAASIGLVVNIGGLFFTPMANELGVGRGSVSLTLTLANLMAAVGGTIMPRVVKPKNYKLIMIVGVVICCGCTVLLGVSSQLWMLYVLNIIRGFATGFVGTVIGTLILNNWFHKNSGTITSIALGFSGLAGAVFSPIFSSLISSLGWRTSYMIAAAGMAVLYLPMLLFPINMTPEAVGTVAYGDVPGTEKMKFEDPRLKKASKAAIPAALFALACVYAACGGLTTTVVQHFPGVAETYLLPASVGAVMLSASMITNTSGKLLLGFLIDRIGVKKSILLIIILVAAGAALILTVHSGVAMIIGAALIGLGYSTSTVGVVMLTRTSFGVENYSRVYPKVALFTTVSYALGTTLVGFIYDSTGAYTLVFAYILASLVLMAAVLLVLTGKKKAA